MFNPQTISFDLLNGGISYWIKTTDLNSIYLTEKEVVLSRLANTTDKFMKAFLGFYFYKNEYKEILVK